MSVQSIHDEVQIVIEDKELSKMLPKIKVIRTCDESQNFMKKLILLVEKNEKTNEPLDNVNHE